MKILHTPTRTQNARSYDAYDSNFAYCNFCLSNETYAAVNVPVFLCLSSCLDITTVRMRGNACSRARVYVCVCARAPRAPFLFAEWLCLDRLRCVTCAPAAAPTQATERFLCRILTWYGKKATLTTRQPTLCERSEESTELNNTAALSTIGSVTKTGADYDCSMLSKMMLKNKACMTTTTPTSTAAPTTRSESPTTATAAPKDNSSVTIIIAVVASVIGLACIIIVILLVVRSGKSGTVNNVNVVVETKTTEKAASTGADPPNAALALAFALD